VPGSARARRRNATIPSSRQPRRSVEKAFSRVAGVVTRDAADARRGLAALVASSAGDVVTGLTLGVFTHRLEALPGLLLLVPAAVGMRGNIFGALGSRLGTAIHAGLFSLSRRRDTLVGQNVAASLVLSLSTSLALALLAKAVAVTFGVEHSISVVDFVVISVVGGVVSSVLVLAITLGVAVVATRRDWDMDHVAAPVVTTAGDMVTLPALFLASYLVEAHVLSAVLALLTSVLAVGAVVAALRSPLPILRRIVAESIGVLLLAAVIDVLAGLTVERRLEAFVAAPGLLVLIPPFLEESGALGGILTSRVATKLHLGVAPPSAVPNRLVRDDFILVSLYALPVFVLLAVSAFVAAAVAHLSNPGLVAMVGASLVAGCFVMPFVIGVAYVASIATFRFGLDPDNHGIPLVTSAMDLIGAFALVLALVALGLV
jgi:mgtE-like transporter